MAEAVLASVREGMQERSRASRYVSRARRAGALMRVREESGEAREKEAERLATRRDAAPRQQESGSVVRTYAAPTALRIVHTNVRLFTTASQAYCYRGRRAENIREEERVASLCHVVVVATMPT